MKLYNKNYIYIFVTLLSLWTRVRIIFGIIRRSCRGTGWGRIWTRLRRIFTRRTGLTRTSPRWLLGLRAWFARSWFWASTFGFLRPTRLRPRRGLLYPRRRSWRDSLSGRWSGWNLLSRGRPFGFLLHIRLFFGLFLFLWGLSFGLLFHDGLCFPMNDPVSCYKMFPLASFYCHWKKEEFLINKFDKKRFSSLLTKLRYSSVHWKGGETGKKEKKNSVRWKCPCVFVCYCRCVRLLSLLPFKPMEDFHRRIIFTYERT